MSLAFEFELSRNGFYLKVAAELKSDVTGVFGPSGAGKTTLLHLLAGIERPQHGFLRWRGMPLLDCAKGRWTPPHRRGMAVVFQEARLFPHLDVASNLHYGEAHLPYDARRFDFEEVISMLGLEHLLLKKAHLLSGGEAQRVALGRALLSAPHVLLLDEPLASLDQSMQQQILPFLLRIKREMGIPMVYVSHDLGSMLQIADELLVLDQGTCLGQGAFLDLVQDPQIANLMGHHGLLNVFQAEIKSQNPITKLTTLNLHFGGRRAVAAQNWMAPPWPFGPGSLLQVGLRPEDIALAIETVPQISMQNQIPGVVDRLFDQGERTLCVVDVGVPLLVEITHHAAKCLQLEAGKPIYALFKTQALQLMQPER